MSSYMSHEGYAMLMLIVRTNEALLKTINEMGHDVLADIWAKHLTALKEHYKQP